MTVQEVFDLLDNVLVDFDHAFGDQCVDWAQIINRLYKAPRLTGMNASDIWNTYPQDFYEKIVSDPDNFPNKGDIVIWGGIPGHIAVARDGSDKNILKTVDQNYPTDSAVHAQDHNYLGVLGWLRPKNPPIDLQLELDSMRNQRDINWNLYQGELGKEIALQDEFNEYKKTHPDAIPTPIPTPDSWWIELGKLLRFI